MKIWWEGQGVIEGLLMEHFLPLFMQNYGGGRDCPPAPLFLTALFEFIGITLGGLFHLLWVFYFFAAVVCNGMYTGQKELDFQ